MADTLMPDIVTRAMHKSLVPPDPEDKGKEYVLLQSEVDGLPPEFRRVLEQMVDAQQAARQARRAEEKAARTDERTGAPNIKAFDEKGEAIMGDIRRHAEQGQGALPDITLVAIDLDGFKPINDTCGHAAGDAALKYVVDFFNAELDLEKGEFFARTGGDEFMAICHGSARDTLKRIGALREKFVKSGFSYRDNEHAPEHTPYLSFSFGVRKMQETDTDFEAATKDADMEMYIDKRAKEARLAAHNAPKILLKVPDISAGASRAGADIQSGNLAMETKPVTNFADRVLLKVSKVPPKDPPTHSL